MDTITCGTCSAQIEDEEKHRAWHAALEEKIRQSVKAGADLAAKDVRDQARRRSVGGY